MIDLESVFPICALPGEMDESAEEQIICGGHAGFVHMGYHTAKSDQCTLAQCPSGSARSMLMLYWTKRAPPHLYIHASAEAELNPGCLTTHHQTSVSREDPRLSAAKVREANMQHGNCVLIVPPNASPSCYSPVQRWLLARAL